MVLLTLATCIQVYVYTQDRDQKPAWIKCRHESQIREYPCSAVRYINPRHFALVCATNFTDAAALQIQQCSAASMVLLPA